MSDAETTLSPSISVQISKKKKKEEEEEGSECFFGHVLSPSNRGPMNYTVDPKIHMLKSKPAM